MLLGRVPVFHLRSMLVSLTLKHSFFMKGISFLGLAKYYFQKFLYSFLNFFYSVIITHDYCCMISFSLISCARFYLTLLSTP